MTSQDNVRTAVHQRKRIRHSRASDLMQAPALGVSVATVAKWRRCADRRDRSSFPQHQHNALPPEAAPLLGWLALRQTVPPQLSCAAVSR